MRIPLHLHLADNVASIHVGRRNVPLADADSGVRDAIDRALADHDGSVAGPLRSGAYVLVDGALVRA